MEENLQSDVNNELPRNHDDNIPDEFNYSKITDEIEAMTEYVEQLNTEVTKMRVECCVANIELLSTIDAVDFEGKINELQKLYSTYKNFESETKNK
ncbi:uncharacterized protein LOC129221498 [Uloborus diversus]|uniref:uncharacterized protein LOC129221498 n=1 Tax=Uloborus diversus TaxID=327109 RepID=UPI002409DF00|nr:uncharacterized protein LOC129221498 [Uloborus diversus]XP_054711957.1 uncharacterized protein LOC129221498 [Uloborus diversus]XP_054711958.1 uncharacterized protein LOC129221498 [Uloborus diversus]